MKVLWVCNIVPLPGIAEALGTGMPVIGGWMTGLAEELMNHSEVELAVCFPMLGIQEVVSGRVGRVDYFGFPAKRRIPFVDVVDERSTSRRLRASLAKIIESAKPDLLHIFGTEFGHALLARIHRSAGWGREVGAGGLPVGGARG